MAVVAPNVVVVKGNEEPPPLPQSALVPETTPLESTWRHWVEPVIELSVKEPSVPVSAKRLVDDAVVAKRLVEVALVKVGEVEAVKTPVVELYVSKSFTEESELDDNSPSDEVATSV